MPIINSIASWLMKKRMHQIELFIKYPIDVQHEWMLSLMKDAQGTEYGQQHDFASIKTYEQFKSQIPVNDYESLKPLIERTRKGEQNLLWHSEILWFAKSSGTTDKSKFREAAIKKNILATIIHLPETSARSSYRIYRCGLNFSAHRKSASL
ncbi:MAG: hypothetical protein K0S12_2040 [Bacteroidetes bacterium]|nr:hypothetical protein [Bacteroidota bacterium]